MFQSVVRCVLKIYLSKGIIGNILGSIINSIFDSGGDHKETYYFVPVLHWGDHTDHSVPKYIHIWKVSKHEPFRWKFVCRQQKELFVVLVLQLFSGKRTHEDQGVL